jgi:phosphatidylglycerophosphatase A
MLATFTLTVAAILISQTYLDLFGKEGDPQEVVIDEVVGFLVAMTWLPLNWKWLLAGFLLFRLLDVFKPFPISYLDRNMKGGMGIVMDDILAGVFASIALQFVYAQGWMP